MGLLSRPGKYVPPAIAEIPAETPIEGAKKSTGARGGMRTVAFVEARSCAAQPKSLLRFASEGARRCLRRRPLCEDRTQQARARGAEQEGVVRVAWRHVGIVQPGRVDLGARRARVERLLYSAIVEDPLRALSPHDDGRNGSPVAQARDRRGGGANQPQRA